jgi:hypothetical protein
MERYCEHNEQLDAVGNVTCLTCKVDLLEKELAAVKERLESVRENAKTAMEWCKNGDLASVEFRLEKILKGGEHAHR